MQKPVDDSIWDKIQVVFRLIYEFLLNNSIVIFLCSRHCVYLIALLFTSNFTIKVKVISFDLQIGKVLHLSSIL